MRNPNDNDLQGVETILRCAKRQCIGTRLAKILTELDPNLFKDIVIVTDNLVLVEPKVELSNGMLTVVLKDKKSNNRKDIDALPPQFRWDAVCAIWNELNCFEI